MIPVLYVDDESTLLEVAKIYLDRTGQFTVTTALSGSEALELLKTTRFDAVISDYQMPGMDGIALLKEVRSAYPQVAFIIFTGRGREEVAIEAYENGADFYLQKGGAIKPQFKELAQKITIAVGKRQAEEALRQSEFTFHSIFDTIQDAIYIYAPDGTIIDVNAGASAMDGYPREYFIGNTPYFLFAPERDDPTLLIKALKNAFNGEPQTLEFWGRHSSGEIIPKEIRLCRGSYFGLDVIIAIARNITERKKAESEIKESKEQLDAIINGSPIPKFVIDRHHHVVFWNRALEQHSSIPASEVIGTTHAWKAFYPSERPVMADLLVDDRTDLFEAWYGEKSSPSPYIEGAFEATDFFPHMGDRGTWLHFTAVAIRDRNGSVIGAVETLEDITGQKNAETALRESEERYRNMVEDQTEFVCRFAPDGTHVFANDAYCRYFGKTRDEIIGKKFSPEIPTDDIDSITKHFRSLTCDHPVDDITHRIIMPDGQVRWQRWSDRAIFDTNGRITEYQSVGKDVTDLKQAEAAANLANEKLQLLATITRHDILNQLTALRAYLNFTQEDETNEKKRELIEREQRIASTIEEQIRFTKDYQTMGMHAPVWQNVREIIHKSSRSLPMKNVKVIVDHVNLEILADPLFEKVFYNLLDNSLRYGGEHMDTITFSSRKEENGVVCVYEDNGVGIPPADKSHIFKRGFGHHTGLGMFLTREILSITGLSITETGTFGKGARFEIVIPKGAYRVI
jgi:PAS domain S-box-containing protein